MRFYLMILVEFLFFKKRFMLKHDTADHEQKVDSVVSH